MTPGGITRIDLTTRPHLERTVLGAGATAIDVKGPHSPVLHTVHAPDPRASEQAYLVDAESGADVAAN